MVNDDVRLGYLQAMGIDLWQRRKDAAEFLALPEERSAITESVTNDVFVANEDDWQSLQNAVATCTQCRLCETRTQTVFGSGNRQADWMLIGEAPGQSEDQQGLPFVGKAGLLLTEMLRAIGLARDDVYIANILKCRPPNNRDPNADEIEQCSRYLQRQCELVRPKIILAVGRIAAQSLLKTDQPVGKLRGKVHILNATPVVVVYHPAYLLRSLIEKRKAWQDLLYAKQVLQSKG